MKFLLTLALSLISTYSTSSKSFEYHEIDFGMPKFERLYMVGVATNDGYEEIILHFIINMETSDLWQMEEFIYKASTYSMAMLIRVVEKNYNGKMSSLKIHTPTQENKNVYEIYKKLTTYRFIVNISQSNVEYKMIEYIKKSNSTGLNDVYKKGEENSWTTPLAGFNELFGGE